MVNLLKTITKYITQNIEDVNKIYNDMFPDDSSEGIIAIHDPSPRKVMEFIDGSCVYQLNISYTARYKNSLSARSKLDSVLNLLDGQKLSDSTDKLTLKIKTVSNVQFVGTDDKNKSIYTCSVLVEYKTNF